MEIASQTKSKSSEKPGPSAALRHLRLGWVWLLIFLTLGIVLELFHGFKLGWYLDVSNEMRRLMWRLAHAHGTFMGIVHLVFAWSTTLLPSWAIPAQRMAGSLLTAASVLIPGGFFLGGLWHYEGDPGLGIVLLPLGAILLFASATMVVVAAFKEGR